MDLLEEMFRYRDEYEKDNAPWCAELRQSLNDRIDKIITEGMQKRRN